MNTTDKATGLTAAEKASAAITNNEFAYYGLRVITKINRSDVIPALNVGDDAPPSREWDNNELTGEMMNGTSALRINEWANDLEAELSGKLGALRNYGTGTIIVIGANSATQGVDAGEYVFRSAKILYICVAP